LKLSIKIFLCCLPALLATGCLGPKVLNETTAHVPASDPKVELRLKTNAPTDILVVYDDLDSQSGKIARRAFYLFANEQRIVKGHRPEFVSLSQVDHLKPVPMLKNPPDDPSAATNDLYAVEMTSRRFQLESRGKLLSAFELPEYTHWLTAKKLFLFPAAVGADAVGVGAVAGAAAVVGMCESGTTIKVH
jgi:hypothetical protein